MTSVVNTAVLLCSVPGCPGRLRVDVRHLANLLAAHWACPANHDEVPE